MYSTPMSAPAQGNARVRDVWRSFGEYLVQETRASLTAHAARPASAAGAATRHHPNGVSELEAVALALAQAELDSPTRSASRSAAAVTGARRRRPQQRQLQAAETQVHALGATSAAQQEVERLRREQMATVRAMLDAEAGRESIDDALQRRDADAAAARLDLATADAAAALREQLRRAPQSVREATRAVERKERQLRQLLRASNTVAVFEGEARRCAAEYEEQMDRIVRRAVAGVGAIADSSARAGAADGIGDDDADDDDDRVRETGQKEEDICAVPLPAEMEELLRSFSASLSGGGGGADDDDAGQPTGLRLEDGEGGGAAGAAGGGAAGGGAEGRASGGGRRGTSALAVASDERATLVRRFDRMMRLFATSCAMEARKIVAEAARATDREHQQTLGSVLRDVRREHIREIDRMRNTIDRAHDMLEHLGTTTATHDADNNNVNQQQQLQQRHAFQHGLAALAPAGGDRTVTTGASVGAGRARGRGTALN